MPVAIKKCEFFTRKTDLIGFIIKLEKLSMDLKKIKAIVNWQELENISILLGCQDPRGLLTGF